MSRVAENSDGIEPHGLVFFRIASLPSLVSKSVVHTHWIPSLPYLTVFTRVQPQFMVE